MNAVNIRANDLMREVTLTVSLSGMRAMAIRLWLGAQIIKLAARVIGCGVKIER